MAEETEPKKASGPGIMGLVKAIAFVSILVVVELVAAAMMIPSPAETEELARDLATAAKGEDLVDGEADEPGQLDEREATREVEIGSFNITRFDPDADKTLNIDFTVYGVVLEEEQAEFEAEFESNRGRIEEQIVMTMHGASSDDLSSAGLGLIKRQILAKTNRAIGRPLLREVVFTKINFVER